MTSAQLTRKLAFDWIDCLSTGIKDTAAVANQLDERLKYALVRHLKSGTYHCGVLQRVVVAGSSCTTAAALPGRGAPTVLLVVIHDIVSGEQYDPMSVDTISNKPFTTTDFDALKTYLARTGTPTITVGPPQQQRIISLTRAFLAEKAQSLSLPRVTLPQVQARQLTRKSLLSLIRQATLECDPNQLPNDDARQAAIAARATDLVSGCAVRCKFEGVYRLFILRSVVTLSPTVTDGSPPVGPGDNVAPAEKQSLGLRLVESTGGTVVAALTTVSGSPLELAELEAWAPLLTMSDLRLPPPISEKDDLVVVADSTPRAANAVAAAAVPRRDESDNVSRPSSLAVGSVRAATPDHSVAAAPAVEPAKPKEEPQPPPLAAPVVSAAHPAAASPPSSKNLRSVSASVTRRGVPHRPPPRVVVVDRGTFVPSLDAPAPFEELFGQRKDRLHGPVMRPPTARRQPPKRAAANSAQGGSAAGAKPPPRSDETRHVSAPSLREPRTSAWARASERQTIFSEIRPPSGELIVVKPGRRLTADEMVHQLEKLSQPKVHRDPDSPGQPRSVTPRSTAAGSLRPFR